MAETRRPGKSDNDGRVRAVIDAVLPCIDGGRFAVKRIAGERFEIEAHCLADGHDVLRAKLRWRAADERDWREVEMKPLGNDRYGAAFVPPAPGRYVYGVTAWVDH
ncbi:MAG TPA: maltotransferase domain-containing protein, partial [Ramlibacter sp.]|nr:maltotransferase domain-containing protein [Ramlibacter sp.]